MPVNTNYTKRNQIYLFLAARRARGDPASRDGQAVDAVAGEGCRLPARELYCLVRCRRQVIYRERDVYVVVWVAIQTEMCIAAKHHACGE